MAIDEADHSSGAHFSDAEASPPSTDGDPPHVPVEGSPIRVGAYTWAEYMREHGYADEVSTLYPDGQTTPDDQLGLDTGEERTVPTGRDWDRVDFDPETHLGYHPDDLPDLLRSVFVPNANVLQEAFLEYVDPETTPVVKDVYTWEHYKWEYYYDGDGARPRTSDGEIERFDQADALGFDLEEEDDDSTESDPAAVDIRRTLFECGNRAMELDELVDERTVNVREDFDEDEFFSTDEGHTTVVNRYDLEKAVSFRKKRFYREVERYWVNKPYAFVIIFHSEKENEKKYYMVEPYFNEIEVELREFLSGKLRTAIKYSEDGIKEKANEDGRRNVIETETRRLLKRYDLFERTSGAKKVGLLETLRTLLDDEEETDDDASETRLEGIETRPEPVVLEEDSDTLSEYQVEKLLYHLKRDFIGYERIDGIKHDINVEDISVDGYHSPVFVYHSEYEQIISNIYHGEDDLDGFVVKLAQRSGKGISKRLPQVDATLPDGSRAQLTLGKEVSDHGTNYTIRQFKDVPFTPVDLINWNTFSLDEMAFLWLAIENHKSLIFAGGTASGKTTSLNAVSLFIPSNTKIVSIEDTREVELPQRNWIASVTRPSFNDDAQGDVDEFDLLEAALRQRPDYIVMGEIRGEEGRTLFQVMSTGHTTYTTFHADSVDEVLKRFTTDPINVSKTMFTALDLVSIQTQTRVQGGKVRRNKSLTEINHYEAEHDEINVQDVYQWQAETDEYLKMGDSNTLSEIQFDRGWSHEKLQEELFKRQVILAYLIKNGLNTYAQVAATVQAFINDPDTILTLVANGQLEDSLEDLREMESVQINVDPEKEELVPRPDATDETYNLSMDILERAEESLFEEYRGRAVSGLASALGGIEPADPITVGGDDEFDFGDTAESDDTWDLGDDEAFTFGDDDGSTAPSWLDDDGDVGPGEGASASADGAVDDAADTPAGDTDAPARPALEEGDAAETATAPASASDLDASVGAVETADATPPSALEDSDERPQFEEFELDAPALEGHAGESAEFDFSDWTSAQSTAEQSDGDDIDALFSDMDQALEDVESDLSGGSAAIDSTDADPEPSSETAEFDEMFPGGDLESIFGDVEEFTTDDGADEHGERSIFGEETATDASTDSGVDDAFAGSDDPSTGSDDVAVSDDDRSPGSLFTDSDDDSIFGDDEAAESLFGEEVDTDESMFESESSADDESESSADDDRREADE
ncbi:ATPase, T2SS/T4P/T4SS family [Natronobiforma cellulositropha]|uniref:ATPase, T2SS/T4P/T4SS family n=1 Tax=Natronobiforma cellulositropha TaxID=1679076 RepID=UPI0021D5B328|nr:ATPase, T2SS/T4P/T4SS family [Natronobiforma cellulositropha]